MDLFEKINRAFGTWYESLFGATDDVRPRDILRAILTALEEHRKEGMDGRVYAPNQFTLEIAPEDDEEKEYLLAFLDRDELETAVRRYCEQNRYVIRGALDFTVREVDPGAISPRARRKFRVRCRYARAAAPMPQDAPAPVRQSSKDDTETVAAVQTADNPTVAEAVPSEPVATLTVHPPDGSAYDVPISGDVLTVGRSSRAGNDLVLGADGMVSRRHVRIELDSDGLFTIYDLNTTNGTRVNGERVDNRTLRTGDEVQLGATRMTFEQHRRPCGTGACAEGDRSPAESIIAPPGYRAVLMDGELSGLALLLASDTVLGRGVTNDIVLPDRSVATRHARIRLDGGPTVESLDPAHETWVDDRIAPVGAPVPIRSGCVLRLGDVRIRIEEVQR